MVEMSKNLKIVLITSFLDRIATSAIIPFMTLYFTTAYNVNFASAILSIQIFIGYISSLIGGFFGDKTDDSKFLFKWQIIHALFQLVVGFLIFFKGYLYLVVCFYLLSILASNFYKSTFKSLLLSSVTSQNKKKAYTIDYVSTNTSIILGSIIGGTAFGEFEYYLFFGSTFSILIIAMVLRSSFNYPKFDKCKILDTKTHENFFGFFVSLIKNYKAPLFDNNFRRYVISMGCFQALGYSLSNMVLVGLQKRHVNISFFILGIPIKLKTSQLYSVLQGINIVIVVMFSMVALNMFKKMSTSRKIVIFGVLMSITYGLLNLPIKFSYMIIVVAIGAICEIIVVPEIQGLEVELIPLNHKSTYSAFDSLESYIGQAVSTLGLIFLNFGPLLPATYIIFVGSLASVLISRIALKFKN